MNPDLARQALEFEALIGTEEVVLPPSESTPEIDTATAVTETADLESFRESICDCMKCSLGATRTKFVFGVGNPNADVMFIGEAPGANEDKQGEPFVGRAGQLLDKILAAIDFKREDVYIANILKCRPANNRDPQPEEMDLCFPYLERQIQLIQPKFICCLGRIAAQRILNTTTPLGKMRGQWFDMFGAKLMVTYHPAALLRNPAFKRGTWEDVQMLRAAYDQQNGDGA